MINDSSTRHVTRPHTISCHRDGLWAGAQDAEIGVGLRGNGMSAGLGKLGQAKGRWEVFQVEEGWFA